MGINARDADASIVYVHHYLHRVTVAETKDVSQNQHHEFAGGVVVVVQEDLVQGRFFEFGPLLERGAALALPIGQIVVCGHPDSHSAAA